MTSGTVTYDRTRGVVTDFGSVREGSYSSRTWSGADWPVTKHVERPRLDSPVIEWTKKGRAILDRQILANNRYQIDLYKRSVRDAQLRKNRTRILEGDKPHAYTYAIDKEVINVDSVVFPGSARVYTVTPMQAGGNPINLFPDLWTPNDDIQLTNRLKNKLMGSSFNAGVFFAELGPAITMITNAASRLYRSRKALLRGDLTTAWKALSPMGSSYAPKVRSGQPIASQWLEMSLGWMPLVSDIEDGAIMIAHNDFVNPSFYVARARLKKRDLENPAWYSAPVPAFLPRFKGSQEQTAQLVAYLREVNVPQLIGLTNAASVAWEIAPFSFLGDYVIPVSNYLSARGVAQALKGEFVTSRKRVTSVTDFAYDRPVITSVPKGVFFKRRVTGSRTVSQSLTVPLPAVKPLNEIAGWKRAANVLALLVTTGTFSKGVRG